jgi:Flp pilus assembly protein TadD
MGAVSDMDPLVRARAARALPPEVAGGDTRVREDPLRLVRLAASPDEARAAAIFNADTPGGRHALGLHAAAAGKPAEAAQEYGAALRLDPRFYPARCNLAILLAAAGRTRDAVPLLEEGVRLSPDEPSLQLNLALAYASVGQLERARRTLHVLLARDPRIEDATRILRELEGGGR